MSRPLRVLLACLATALLAAGCGDGTHKAAAPAPSGDTTVRSVSGGGSLSDWTTYHHTATRSGHVSMAPKGRLHRSWRTNLRGAVYGEPLVVGQTVIVATERNYVYGLQARSGKVRWRTHLGLPQPLSGLPCGNIDPLGVTGTPVDDPKTGSVFVAAETQGAHHSLYALSASTGKTRWHRSLDTQTHRNRYAEQQRSALLLVGGRVITTFGGLAGDCSNYVGYATSVATSGAGPIYDYAVPTSREAGMWSPAGPVLGSNGKVYVASGNGAELRGRWDKSDSVTELSPVRLQRLAIFAPSTWPDDNARDLDLGSMSPAMVPAVNRMVIAGKRGVVYLLRPSLGGVGSALRSLGGCPAFGGAAVAGRTVLMPCLGANSIRALVVGSHSLRWSWTRHGIYSSPVIAGKKVYVADRNSGRLVVLRLGDGQVIQSLSAGRLPHFPSQVVSGDWVFVSTLDGVSAFHGS